MHSSVPESLNAAESTSGPSTLDLVVQAYESRLPRGESSPSAPAPTTVIGRLVGFDTSGQPLVKLPGDDSVAPLAARATLRLHPAQINSEVVLIFAGDDCHLPIVMGCLVPPVPLAVEPVQSQRVELNGQRLELTAQDEIILRCGKSSITLTQAGKVIIRGEYLLSRSSGVNRIKGGSVQIN